MAENYSVRKEEGFLEKSTDFAFDKVSKEVFRTHLHENCDLLNIAEPIIEKIFCSLKSVGFSIILTDEEGVILAERCCDDVECKLLGMGIRVGNSLSQIAIGKNAIGVVLQNDALSQVSEQEHGDSLLNDWICSAAPIHDINGEMIGVIDIAGHKKMVHPHTLSLVIIAAKAIENKIESNHIQNRLFDAQQYAFSMMNNLSYGVFAIDMHDYIHWVNDTACRSINIRRTELIDIPIDRIFEQWRKVKHIVLKELNFIDEELCFQNIDNNGKYLFNAYPIKTKENEILGFLLTFRPYERALRLVKKLTGMHGRFFFDDIIAKSASMKKIVAFSKTVAKSPSTILITGESGTGKEVFAQSIHNESDRKDAGFVAINCGAISSGLIESELFGYDDGAFTGARKGGRPGKFELADKGTLFLDEIGEMEMDMQVKLLRVLQEGMVNRVGSDTITPVDVRIIAATNKNLEKEVRDGKFRLDLFYRLNVISINIPPLRRRKDDIPPLINLFLQKKSSKLNRPIPELSAELKADINNYNWPGNTRELENFIEKIILLDGNVSLNPDFQMGGIGGESESSKNIEKDKLQSLWIIEKEAVVNTIIALKGNMTNVAKTLGIGRNTLYSKIKRYDIDVNKLMDFVNN